MNSADMLNMKEWFRLARCSWKVSAAQTSSPSMPTLMTQ